jgi:hypothetical protein
MSNELRALVEEMRSYRMSPQELEAQTVSFAFGNGRIEDERITRAGVVTAVKSLDADGVKRAISIKQ